MRDLQALAAQILRAGLWSGTALVVAASTLDLAGAARERLADITAATGIGVVIATPFVALLAMAVRARRHVLGLYAAATLALALVGILLAA
jgi:hypothetical protein